MLPQIGILLIAVLALGFIAWVLACTMSGRYEPIILVWALLAPLGYAVLAYPHERSIITLHRVVILPLVVLILLFPPLATGKLNRQLTWLAVTWGCFVLGALISVINVTPEQKLYAIRTAIDAFVLPLLLGWVVYRTFRVHQHLSWLHVVICLVSIYLAVIGGLEIYTGQALMPQAGNPDVLYAGEGMFAIVRPTGPYANPAVLSLVGMINFFLLLFCKRVMGTLPLRNKTLHWAGLLASLLVALMTFTRGVIFAFALIILIETWRSHNAKQRVLGISAALALVIAVAFAIWVVPSDVTRERTSGDNLFARLAQQVQTIEVFRDHPLIGVGLCNFGSGAGQTSRYESSVYGYAPVGDAHNFLGEMLATTGLLGFLPLLSVQFLLCAVFWRMKLSGESGSRLVWRFFLMIFVSFWVLNMDFGLGDYSELNLWYVFALSILCRYAVELKSNTGYVTAGFHRNARCESRSWGLLTAKG